MSRASLSGFMPRHTEQLAYFAPHDPGYVIDVSGAAGRDLGGRSAPEAEHLEQFYQYVCASTWAY
jgi:hypothetical protein